MIGRAARPLGMALAVCCLVGGRAAAQENIDRQIQGNRERLEAIRREREQLQAELDRLRGRAHTIAGELSNIERQRNTTGRLVNELDRQIRSMGSSLDTVTIELGLTQDALAEKRAILYRRLADIYKRGSLWTFQVLLSAESFGDLLSRYKYLYLVSRQDRALVGVVEELRDRIDTQRRQMLNLRGELSSRRTERSRELDRYANLERRRERSLRETRASERAAVARMDSLTRDQQRLNNVIAALERARRAGGPRATTPSTPSITTEDLGGLDWPVDGKLVYGFGPARLPNNTVIRQNGIGIGVPVGTPVHAVAPGVVDVAGQLGTYGGSVVIDHGAGYYTLYLYLSRLDVREGDHVERGAVIGRSGGAASEQGPHIEFQIRGEGSLALDPLNWLKARP